MTSVTISTAADNKCVRKNYAPPPSRPEIARRMRGIVRWSFSNCQVYNVLVHCHLQQSVEQMGSVLNQVWITIRNMEFAHDKIRMTWFNMYVMYSYTYVPPVPDTIYHLRENCTNFSAYEMIVQRIFKTFSGQVTKILLFVSYLRFDRPALGNKLLFRISYWVANEWVSKPNLFHYRFQYPVVWFVYRLNKDI